MTTTDWIQAISTLVLVLVTIFYAWQTWRTVSEMKKQAKDTADLAKSTKIQADANVKMAKEMYEQRIMESRPVIIQKAVHTADSADKWIEYSELTIAKQQGRPPEVLKSPPFKHFEIYNAGNGPAIELKISVLDKEKNGYDAKRRTYLRPSDESVEFTSVFSSNSYKENATYYLVSEYQGIFSRSGEEEKWYQTWLPFKIIKTSKPEKVLVICGELDFKEVSEKERINAFADIKNLMEK